MALYSVLKDTNSPSYIIFVGDWVRQNNNWFQIVDCDGGMQCQTHTGEWLWADTGDIDEVLSNAEFKRTSFYNGKQFV